MVNNFSYPFCSFERIHAVIQDARHQWNRIRVQSTTVADQLASPGRLALAVLHCIDKRFEGENSGYIVSALDIQLAIQQSKNNNSARKNLTRFIYLGPLPILPMGH